MLELGNGGEKPRSDDLVIDSDETRFMEDVIEASREKPVIVDFWAPWSGPCRTLGPALEKAVREAGGKVRMVKINVDENQTLAAQLRIQSIPTVYAFHDGKPVDGFMGALPPSEIGKFIERVLAEAGADGGLAAAVEAAKEALAEGKAQDAAEILEAVLAEEPENAAALGALAQAKIALGDLEAAERLLEDAPATAAEAAEVRAAKSQLELARQAAEAGPLDELRARIEADPDDLAARYDLAIALHAGGDVAGAVDQLLEIVARDRDWEDGKAREQLVKIFDSLPPNDPVVLKGRRRLSSLMFA